ncbi:tim44-like domain protein [Orientia chuto str. Dubai]|uniref:Tim44-like domain protein n=1 Tax=Orientia chuto str. Dubai TaxID=1359168 RepID=A0A0F3MLZ1_9RICK|nr:hypothetical protein [Candidatus Orientia mediorientalis]KJV56755.1 tim44-like domain protein [Orientia chuto str. Dubai]
MFTHLVELITLLCITLLLIRKLISILGSTNEDERNKYKSFKSYFGEPSSLKDVTNTTDITKYSSVTRLSCNHDLDFLKQNNLVIHENTDYIITELVKLKSKVHSFDINKFYNTAINVIKIIIEAVKNSDQKKISSLLDERFIEQFHQTSSKYVNIAINNINFKLSSISSLSNSFFIKILIEIDGSNFKEEWRFSKNITVPGPQWYLSNIEEL